MLTRSSKSLAKESERKTLIIMGISSLILFLAATHLTLPNDIFVTMWSEQLLNMYILVSHQQTRLRKLSTSWSCAAHQQCIWLDLGSCFLSGYIFGSSWVIYGCKEFSQQKVTPHLGSSPVPWKSIHDWRQNAYYQKLHRAFPLILSEAKTLVNSNFIILQCPDQKGHLTPIHSHNTISEQSSRDWGGSWCVQCCKPKTNASIRIGDHPPGALRNETHVSGDN